MGARGPKAKPVNVAVAAAKADRRRASWKSRRATRAERVIRFVESLPITQGFGAGGRVVVHPFQRRIIEAIYSPVGEDGRRLVRTALVTLPRKSGKSTTAAALVLAHLVGPEVEPRGQIYSAATDRQQAGIIFAELLAMLERRPSLLERLHVQAWQKSITDKISGTIYQALSSDARKAHGLNPSVVIADELAQWRSRTLYDNLVSGMGGRPEPLTVVISTRSPDPHHVMSELVAYGQQVLDGVIEDPTFAPVIYAAPADADWLDEDGLARLQPGDRCGLPFARGDAGRGRPGGPHAGEGAGLSLALSEPSRRRLERPLRPARGMASVWWRGRPRRAPRPAVLGRARSELDPGSDLPVPLLPGR